jgi:hypothetical protein
MHREDRAIALEPRHLASDADDSLLPGFEIPREIRVVLFVVRRGHQDVHVAAHDFVFPIPKQPLGSRVERLDGASRVDDDDAVDG